MYVFEAKPKWNMSPNILQEVVLLKSLPKWYPGQSFHPATKTMCLKSLQLSTLEKVTCLPHTLPSSEHNGYFQRTYIVLCSFAFGEIPPLDHFGEHCLGLVGRLL